MSLYQCYTINYSYQIIIHNLFFKWPAVVAEARNNTNSFKFSNESDQFSSNGCHTSSQRKNPIN